MPEIEGFILAGGASSRMGADKAHLLIDGVNLTGRVAAALRAFTESVSVVSSKPDAAAFGLPVVRDVYAGVGALGGIHAALRACAAEWAAVVSCDLPFVTSELLRRLDSARGAEWDVVAPLQEDGRPQPLCALYRRAKCLGVSEQMICAGELRPRLLLNRVRTRRLSFDELQDLTCSPFFFRNVNTPEDYEAAVREFRAQTPGD